MCLPPAARLALALVVPVALLVGFLLVVVPARRAPRIRVSDVLRAQ